MLMRYMEFKTNLLSSINAGGFVACEAKLQQLLIIPPKSVNTHMLILTYNVDYCLDKNLRFYNFFLTFNTNLLCGPR